MYLTDDVHCCDAGRGDLAPIGKCLVGNISAEALMNIAQVSWVTDLTLLGGRGRVRLQFNGRNEDTDYDSGNEMHLEFAGKQYLPNHFSFGVGPEVSCQFNASKAHPLTLDLRWYHEFEAKNRVAGDAVFLSFSVPLAITQKPQAEQDWSAAEGQN